MIERNSKESYTFWQEAGEDGVGETAVLIEEYSTTITLQQEGNRVSLNYESLPELIKTLKELHKKHS